MSVTIRCPANFQIIPDEVIQEAILPFLEGRSLRACSAVSKQFREWCCKEFIWEPAARQIYRLYPRLKGSVGKRGGNRALCIRVASRQFKEEEIEGRIVNRVRMYERWVGTGLSVVTLVGIGSWTTYQWYTDPLLQAWGRSFNPSIDLLWNSLIGEQGMVRRHLLGHGCFSFLTFLLPVLDLLELKGAIPTRCLTDLTQFVGASSALFAIHSSMAVGLKNLSLLSGVRGGFLLAKGAIPKSRTDRWCGNVLSRVAIGARRGFQWLKSCFSCKRHED